MIDYQQLKKNRLLIIFWMLTMVFLIVVSVIFLPIFKEFLSGIFMITSGGLLIILGGGLIFFALQQKVKRKLKYFLLLTGASGAGFFIFVFLHNLFYGLGSITKEVVILSNLLKVLEVAFFLLAIIICPIAFLVGVIGSIANNISSTGG